MMPPVLYLKPGRRMPVAPAPQIYPRDIQQDIPCGWCSACARELYRPGTRLCRRCLRRRKQNERYEIG